MKLEESSDLRDHEKRYVKSRGNFLVIPVPIQSPCESILGAVLKLASLLLLLVITCKYMQRTSGFSRYN